MIGSIISFLSGKKTYLVGILTIVLGYLNGDQNMIMTGIGMLTLRAAISKLQ